jgi:hypothetical protein
VVQRGELVQKRGVFVVVVWLIFLVARFSIF